ncbi:Heat shock factor protein 5 [Tripterygium wilfordii]|uniref:Heat shock factor protein 5 n=1 Tax=Tripterygium wilfordii TaxID=458696 RepID=A0A7J7DPN0_TRIWF|nr:heat stress transcription factor A-8 [Tripterygium wilfordii]KAF5748046.1 Heat shock factor protein 5 [Tripterygium wilfordii]
MVKSGVNDDGSQSIPPFLRKCYEMVDDESSNPVISWSQNDDSFVIWNMTEFSVQLLPKFFKHNNFSSFMRQLNIYGFRKIDSDRWEFSNDGFIKGQKHLLKNICRRKHSQSMDNRKTLLQQDNKVESSEEIENPGLWKEVENLKTDKNSLMQQLVNLRQHQETADDKLLVLKDRLQGMEKNQQQMLSFLVIAMKIPGFLVQLLQPKENNWRMAESGGMLERGIEDGGPPAVDGMIVRYQLPLDELPSPVLVPTDSGKPQQSNHSFDGMKDYFVNSDFMKMLLDEKLCSFESQVPFVLPDLPDDGAWEQLLLASPVRQDSKHDSERANDTEMEIETSSAIGTDFEVSKRFETAFDLMVSSQNLESKSTELGNYPMKS